jgi:hypothetical protein
MRFPVYGAVAVLVLYAPNPLLSQQPSAAPPQASAKSAPDSARPESADPRFERFARQFSNVKLVGRFTVIGKEDKAPAKEEYTILKVDKLPVNDKWMFHCRIKYGQHDLTLPLPLDVKWADDTPVITLTELAIPPLGTFSARVVLHDDKYAGTWRHDLVSGHLFGTIEKLVEGERPAAPK